MCGVIGYAGIPQPDLLRRLFFETNIRGQHASGISFVNSEIHTELYPGPHSSEQLLERSEGLNSRLLIGHARYSTSSLEFNQPLTGEELSIVHNGVISQEDPIFWTERFGYVCHTKNDSELILRSMEHGDHPLEKFPEASIAACVLSSNGLRFFRNGKRPLWFLEGEGFVVISSTKDILIRTGIKGIPISCVPGREYLVDNQGFLIYRDVLSISHNQDLQYASIH